MQKDFINIAAHELRTPIQPILGLSEAVLSKSKDESQRESLEVVVRNAKRLKRLIENVLDITRIESNALKLYVEVIDLNKKIRIVVNDEISSIPQGKELEIIFDQRESAPLFVKGDKSRLFEVLSNLIGNAIKFTDLGGTIKITAEKSAVKNEVIVSVKDTGKGIDMEILPRLFTKFATKSQAGTGLGLFISQNIVEAHGGKIWGENNKDGNGATFTFTLPLIS
jgi:two-component system, OmpR family, sensor histidine kinase VicK